MIPLFDGAVEQIKAVQSALNGPQTSLYDRILKRLDDRRTMLKRFARKFRAKKHPDDNLIYDAKHEEIQKVIDLFKNERNFKLDTILTVLNDRASSCNDRANDGINMYDTISTKNEYLRFRSITQEVKECIKIIKGTK